MAVRKVGLYLSQIVHLNPGCKLFPRNFYAWHRSEFIPNFSKGDLSMNTIVAYAEFIPDYRFVWNRAALTTGSTCWKCGGKVQMNMLTCDGCQAIQEINHDANFFRLFGLDDRFTVDTATLTKKFRDLQAQFHPDKFAQKTQREQEYSSLCSSLLNTAYQTLVNPVERGLYLLRLNGRDISEDDFDIGSEFLLGIMEKNEWLAGDVTSAELTDFEENNRTVIEELQSQLADAFHRENWESAKHILGKLKYYVNIENKIKCLEMKFGITR